MTTGHHLHEHGDVISGPAAWWEGADVSVAEVLSRLGALRDQATQGAAHGRAMLLNLVVWAHTPEVAAGAAELLDRMVGPSRLVVVGKRPDRAGIDARVEVFTRPGPIAGGLVCEELVSLTLGSDIAAHARSVVIPLIRGDLPTVLWWPCAPQPTEAAYRQLTAAADRVVVESDATATGHESAVLLAEEVAERECAITDLAWAALTPWRQLVAQLVGRELALTLREGPSRLTVVHGGGEPTLQALLMAGWMRDVLGDALDVVMDAAPLDAGALAALELVGPGGRHLRLERSPGSASVSVAVGSPGDEGKRRALPLRLLDRTGLLAGELEMTTHDRGFESAIRQAARIA